MSSNEQAEEKEWPLDVYRYREAQGWEKQVPADLAEYEHHGSQPHATGIPKEGEIHIKRFRMKIALTSRHATKSAPDTTNQNNSAINTDEENSLQRVATDLGSGGNSIKDMMPPPLKKRKVDKKESVMEVVRRNDCLLLTSKRQRVRAIVLKFPSTKDCSTFSDELIKLNRSLPELVHTDLQGTGSVITQAGNAPETSAEVQDNDTLSYIARLLHDKDFLSLMGHVEAAIKTSPSGATILEALTKQASVGSNKDCNQL